MRNTATGVVSIPAANSSSKTDSSGGWLRSLPLWMQFPGKLPRGSVGISAAALLLTSLLIVGCANPGPPKPPSLHLPALVTDLNAERTGNRVLLHWTTPAATTDGFTVKGAMTAEICRESGPRLGTGPGSPGGRLAACAPVLRLAVAPGPSFVAESLPSSLCSNPSVLLTYRVQIFNSVDRSAGESAPAFAAAGKAPPPIESLNATPSEHGPLLEWGASVGLQDSIVELTRISLAATQSPAKPVKSAKPHPGGRGKSATPAQAADQNTGQVHLRAADSLGGTVDTNASFGDTYIYTAERVLPIHIGPHALEIHSEPSSPVTIALRDTFPPASPVGLATIPGNGTPPYIDLSWEPNAEADLAGYLVYRQLTRPNGDPEGPLARLTPTPVTAPAYRDVAVSPGRRYIYWVTAVDASGNESAPSAKALEAVDSNRSQ